MALFIDSFHEGLESVHQGFGSFQATTHQIPANDFELLRLMSGEMSLRTRGEALGLRSSFMNRTFTLQPSETTPSTIVSDLIRKIDFEHARLARLLSTLPADKVDVSGLQVSESDLFLILIKSLPHEVRQFVLHHAADSTHQSYRLAARKWEEQQRLYAEVHGGAGRKLGVSAVSPHVEVFDMSSGDVGNETWEEGLVEAVDELGKCGRCGKKGHDTGSCQTDLSGTKCSKCVKLGHIGKNCRVDRSKTSKGKTRHGRVQ